MGGQCDDGNFFKFRVISQLREDFDTIHAWERNIEENEVGYIGLEAPEGFKSCFIFGNVVELTQEGTDEEAVIFVVFNDGDGFHVGKYNSYWPKVQGGRTHSLSKIRFASFDRAVDDNLPVASPFDFRYSIKVMVVLNSVKNHKSRWPANESNPFPIIIIHGGLMKRSFLLLSAVALLFCGALTAFAQIPNASFENWTSGTPDSWWTNNVSAVGWTPVTQSRTAHTGTFAVRGDVITALALPYYSPQIVTGTAAGGFPVSQRSATITGYYQFSPAASSGDRFSVTATLFKGGASGTAVAIAAAALPTAFSSYTQFSVPFQYLTGDVPDLCIITIIILGPASGNPHVGSYFLLDDLALSGTASAVGDEVGLPGSFALEQNYPNPFNPSTNIRYSVAQAGHVSLKVYNVLGVEVASLVNEQKDAGTFRVNWNAAGLPSGMYLYRMSVTSDKGQVYEQSRKLALLK
jgi:hypothetical protein